MTTMEGGVMQARTFRDIGRFDRSVRQLRRYFDQLQREASVATGRGAEAPHHARTRRTKPVKPRKRRTRNA
jgi:hypothetical protein